MEVVEVERLLQLGCCNQTMMRIHNFLSRWVEAEVEGWSEFLDLLDSAKEPLSQRPSFPEGP